jgi:hypothetical protein
VVDLIADEAAALYGMRRLGLEAQAAVRRCFILFLKKQIGHKEGRNFASGTKKQWTETTPIIPARWYPGLAARNIRLKSVPRAIEPQLDSFRKRI